MPDLSPVKPSPRKGKDREHREPDLAEKFIMHQRRTAASTRPKDRSERTQPSSSSTPRIDQSSPKLSSSPRKLPVPQVVVSKPTQEADPDEFSRLLKISSSPRSNSRSVNKLYNPDTDAIPMRYIPDSEGISDRNGSSFSPRPHHSPQLRENSHQRQLFDHRKDDPVRFSVLTRPPPANGSSQKPPAATSQSSADCLSASSTSSYAHSTLSSNFTLSTDGSSASSALFDGRPHAESTTNALSAQLKRLYRAISTLESKVVQEDEKDQQDEPRIVLKGKDSNDEDVEKDRWKRVLDDHKKLAEMVHNLLQLTLANNLPASLRNIPERYNLIMRLWLHGFHRPLENLRRCAVNNSPVALEHLQDFIYYAYTFYTCLYEEENLSSYRINWMETLGDLARYRMAVSELVSSKNCPSAGLTKAALSQMPSSVVDVFMGDDAVDSQSSNKVPRNSKGSNSPSVGIQAARSMEMLPEKEKWRNTAREWYAKGLAEFPGMGKLHHHMGFLCKEFGEEEELRGIYHFVKSMTTTHPFSTSRESILALWSPAAQTRRSLPESRVSDLYVLLQGMLFTNIQLDGFQPTLSRFLERLQIESASEHDWIMMGVINIASIFEFGRPTGVLYSICGITEGNLAAAQNKVRLAKKSEEKKDSDHMDVDDIDEPRSVTCGLVTDSPKLAEAAVEDDLPVVLRLSLQLTFSMFAQVLKNPTRKTVLHGDTTNPYITVILTFLSTVMKTEFASIFERVVPWKKLAEFLSTVPRRIIRLEAKNGRDLPLLTSGCSPLPEDACLRGMAWGGRKIYERGFWTKSNETPTETEVLDKQEAEEPTDGIIEDEDETGDKSPANDQKSRWVRIYRAGVKIAKYVDGFGSVVEENGKRSWRVEGVLAAKVARWIEIERLEREEEEMRRIRKRWDDSMDIDEEAVENLFDSDDDDSDDDAEDSEEVKSLRARRRYLRSLLHSSRREPSPTLPRRRKPRQAKKVTPKHSGRFVPGYTVLVIDTNIILSSLAMFISLVEILKWTVIIPLPVVMELDGLSSSSSPQLAETAKAGLDYISSHLKSLSISLKVQTSKGNYLSSLSVRTEQVDFDNQDSWEKNMDDLILRAAIWHDEHWLDRSAILSSGEYPARDTTGAAKVVLLSLDRNLRLKARSRQLAAANEADLAFILSTGT